MPYTLDELYTDAELDVLTISELREVATEWSIDITGLTLKKDILTAVKLYFATERAKVEPVAVEPTPAASLIESPNFRPIDKDGKDIKSQFKVEEVDVWKRCSKKVKQLSIIPPAGWSGGTRDAS